MARLAYPAAGLPVPRGVNRVHPIVAQTTANRLYCLPNPFYAHGQ